MDGINSMIRYYKNNFADGFRQDAIDLFLGNYHIDPNEGKSVKCPLQDRLQWKYLTVSSSLVYFRFLILIIVLSTDSCPCFSWHRLPCLSSVYSYRPVNQYFIKKHNDEIEFPLEHSTETLLYLLFWLAMVSMTLLGIFYYGSELADYPKLTDVRPRRQSD